MKRVLLPRRRALILSGGALAAPMIASGVARAADDWPNKPVKYIVVFPAGGPTDTLSRIVCRELEKLTNQQFIIENKSGSGGVVGAEAIARSAPDGYTIGLYTIAAHAIAPTLYTKLPFDAGKDFTGIAILWEVPNMLMTRLDFPANTVPELIALAEGQSRQVLLRLVGRGHQPADHRRAVQEHGRRQHPARALSRQRACPPGHPGGPGRHDVRQHPGPARPDEGRQGEGVRRHLQGAPSGGPRHRRPWPSSCRASRSPRGAASAARPACRRRWSRGSRTCSSRRWRARPSRRRSTSRAPQRRWLNPADTAAYRADNEKRLAPVIKASGAKVE